MDGVIIIHKEQGFTSHDVVAKLRGILKMKKIGHTGTLDPMATGVLPVCLGKATKLCDMLTDHSKTYRAVLLLGRVTDTQDITGKILEEKELDMSISELKIRQTFDSFLGKSFQIPPMYSALKVGGRKLYELAREGKTIERKPRPIEITCLEIEAIDLPRVTFRVQCSKGTYIRTLCQDIGEKLGCGACMESLIRIQVGQFLLSDALTLEQVQQYQEKNILENYMIKIENMFPNCPKAVVLPDMDRLLHNGNVLLASAECFTDMHKKTQQKICMYDSRHQFIGIYSYHAQQKCFKPLKMFFGG